MSFKGYIIGVVISMIIGVAMTFGIYLYFAFVIFLIISSIGTLFLVGVSLYQKTSVWKKALRILSFGYIAVMIANVTFNVLENRNRRERDEVIAFFISVSQKGGKVSGQFSSSSSIVKEGKI